MYIFINKSLYKSQITLCNKKVVMTKKCNYEFVKNEVFKFKSAPNKICLMFTSISVFTLKTACNQIAMKYHKF
jgi:hypothetical protein